MKAIVVYYSLDGNTELVAQAVAARLGADVLALEPEKPVSKNIVKKYLVNGRSSLMDMAPALKPYEFNADDYDTVILGAPIWAGHYAPPLRTFALENDLFDKKIAMFMCCGGGSAKRAFLGLKHDLCIEKENIAAALRFIMPTKSDPEALAEKIDGFCERIERA